MAPSTLDASGSLTAPGGTMDNIPPFIATILDEFLQAIRPAMGLLLTVTILASMLIPLLITLFYLSDTNMRRKPIFILNVVSILLGIGIGILSDYIELVSILSPTTNISVSLYVGFTITLLFAPWLSEFVLACRLLAVFPPNRTQTRKLILVFAFPVVIKVVRFAVLIAFIRHFVDQMKGYTAIYEAVMAVDYRHLIYVQLEWYLQIFDNTYLSSLFIWRLLKSQRFARRAKRRSLLREIYGSLASRVKTLLWIALSNFVIPVILNIALIIDLNVDPNYHVNVSYLVLVNYYVSVISVVFATVWSSTYSHQKKRSLESHGTDSSRAAPPTNDSQDTRSQGKAAAAQSPVINIGHTDFKAESSALSWDDSGHQEEDMGIPLRVFMHIE